MRSTLEKNVGMKFEIYRALTYRQSPYFPPQAGIGPQLIEADYIIKVWYYYYSTLRYHFITSFLLFMHVRTKLYKMKRIFVSYIHRLWHSQRNRQSAIILLWKPISRPIHIHYWPIGQIWIFMLLFTRCVFVVPVEMWNDLSSIDLLLLHVTIHL